MSGKKIAVLGGGNGAHMMAAELSLKGNEVRMFEFAEFCENLSVLFKTQRIKLTGLYNESVKLALVTNDIEEAVSGADYVLMVIPAFTHDAYIEVLCGKLKKEQILVVFPGAFATLKMKKAWGENCPDILAETNNLPYDTRLTGPAKAALFGRNVVNIAFMPAHKGESVVEQMRRDLFPFNHVYTDVLECGLSVLNPAIHTGPCLLNISNIENPTFDFYVYEHGVTPSSIKLNKALDIDRKTIGKAIGYDLHPIEDFGGFSNDYSWKDLYKAMHGEIALTPISGPNDIFARYLTEDCPYGLVPWSSIAKLVGVATPIIDSCINIYTVIHETDWWSEGVTAKKLGLTGMSPEEIKEYVRTGHRVTIQ